MADEPTLPILSSNLAFDPIRDDASRKRVRLDSDNTTQISSDPPLFSSDDDPSAENYSGLRRHQKKKFRGPWFKQELELGTSRDGVKTSKRTFQRQFDSAVWLGSDGTDVEDESIFPEAGLPPSTPANILSLPMRQSPVRLRASQTSKEHSSPEELAQKQIELCLEVGKEDIDLSARGLTYLSNSTIRPLISFASIPYIGGGAQYQNLRPALKLFLASNKLRHVPGEIFNLTSLKVLSLRSNDLSELPSAIGKLHRIIELNLSNNHFNYLPYDILNLFTENSRLQNLHLQPNPFYEYNDSKMKHQPLALASQLLLSQDSRSWNPLWKVRRKGRSFVRFLDIEGSLVKGPRFGNVSQESIDVAPLDDNPSAPLVSTSPSRVPSLFEIATRTWSKSPNMPSLSEYLGYDPPERPSMCLADASILRESEGGDRLCTICKRAFVISRTEWIEWWQISKVQQRGSSSAASPLRQMENARPKPESVVPLIRRGCSWMCVPPRIIFDEASTTSQLGTEAENSLQ